MQPKCLILPFVLANACLLQLSYARAEVQVSGTKEVVVIEAKRASLGEVIAALNSVLEMQIHVKPEIQNSLTGTILERCRKCSAECCKAMIMFFGIGGAATTFDYNA